MDKQQIIQIIKANSGLDQATMLAEAKAGGIDDAVFLEAWNEVKGKQTTPVGNLFNNSPTEKPKAYDPGWYLLVGFLLTVIPIFIMSHHNSKVFPNGAEIWKRVRIYMWLYIGMFICNFAILVWATSVISNFLTNNPDAAFRASMPYFGGVGGQEAMLSRLAQQSSEISSAVSIVNNANVSTFCVSLLFLILLLKFTKKNEEPAFKEMRKTGQIDRKNALIPVIIGIAISVVIYYGSSYAGSLVVKGISSSAPSQSAQDTITGDATLKAKQTLEETETVAKEAVIKDSVTDENIDASTGLTSPSLPKVPVADKETLEPYDCGEDRDCLAQSFKDCRYTIAESGHTEVGPLDAERCYYKIGIGTDKETNCTLKMANFSTEKDLVAALFEPTTKCL